MSYEAIELSAALATFDDLWNPRIVARINDYDVRVTKVAGEYVWHTHEKTDEFFFVIDGELRIGLRDDRGEHEVVLPKGSIYVVPRGMWHRPVSEEGASIMVIEPEGMATTGDVHEEIPEHIPTTTGSDF